MIDKRIVLATGNSRIDDLVKEYTGYNIVGSAKYSDDLEDVVKNLQPEILLVTESIKGNISLHSSLLKIKGNNPQLRIIYVLGELNLKSTKDVDSLALLVLAGIYDIIIEPKISIDMLKRAIDDEKEEEDVKYIYNASSYNKKSNSGKKANIEFVMPKEFEEKDEDLVDNLFAISSVKPGTGKSFISVNLAAAIAEYGKPSKNRKSPKVGLIEADLQNLSLGTLLQIEDKNKNIKKALEKISEILDEEGNLKKDEKKILEVDEYIKNCFVPYSKNKNLLALVGSHITFEELQDINSFHYMYLIDSIIDYFDVLIIDTNSALTHTTTYPMLKKAKACYYVLNLDYNNARNNARYRDTLKRMGLSDKVKYVLNENITKEMEKEYDEKLLFNADSLEKANFKLEAKIPVIPKPIFLNKLYQGIPIVLDKSKKTEEIRREILKVANQIYPLKNM